MIREATEHDVPSIVEMAVQFWAHTSFEEPADADHIRVMVVHCLNDGIIKVYDNDGPKGFIAGIMGPLLGSPLAFQAVEVGFWLNPEYRKGRCGEQLLNAFEQQAIDHGCQYVTLVSMVSSSPEVAEAIYLSKGYKKTETSFTKRIA
jgi:GNAT superfamily N-acetyltransferase